MTIDALELVGIACFSIDPFLLCFLLDFEFPIPVFSNLPSHAFGTKPLLVVLESFHLYVTSQRGSCLPSCTFRGGFIASNHAFHFGEQLPVVSDHHDDETDSEGEEDQENFFAGHYCY